VVFQRPKSYGFLSGTLCASQWSNRQNSVPIAIVIPGWERHLAAIPIEAGRLSHI
jgi:hypothetical protein